MWDRLPRLAPLLIGVPVFVAIVRSLGDIASLGHPYFADLSGTSVDAHHFFAGGALYQDPADGYTPQAYPPLLPLTGAALDHVHLWSGWPVLVVMVGELGLIALAAALAYRPASPALADRLLAGAGAAGFGALVWWLVGSVPFNFRFVPRPDELEWAFALGGLALVPVIARGSRVAMVAGVLLLSAACWTKQTGVLACVVALAALGLAAYSGRASWRVPLVFAAALGALNLAVFAALELGTHGWAGRFLLDLPGRHPRVVPVTQGLRELVEAAAPALALGLLFAVALGVMAWSSGRPLPAARDRRQLWPEDWRSGFAVVLALFVVADFLPSAYFRGALGAVQNNYLGVVWALGLLVAFGFGLCLRRSATAAVAALGIVVLFAVSESDPAKRALARADIFVAPKSARAYAVEEPSGLRAYARSRTVWHPVFNDLGGQAGGRLYPGQQNVVGLLSAGYQPGYLARALLDRRFDVAYLFDDGPENAYQSSAGTWEDNYLWKLNQVIRAKYRPISPTPPALAGAQRVIGQFYTYVSPTVLERRPGPDPAPWMRYCFGPFDVAGVRWNIRHGGGLWCRPGGRGAVLRLVRTPALLTEVRATSGRDPEGSLTVSVPTRHGGFSVTAGSGDARWSLTGRATASAMRLELAARDRRVAVLAPAAGPWTLRLAPQDGAPRLRAAGDVVTLGIPRGSRGRLSLAGTFDSQVSYDLSGLRLGR